MLTSLWNLKPVQIPNKTDFLKEHLTKAEKSIKTVL